MYTYQPEIKQAGEGKIDTGKKYRDSTGAVHKIFRKTLAVDALANAGTKNVAHGEAISLTKYMRVKLWISNGTIQKNEFSAGVTSVDVNTTNVVIVSSTDLSLYVNGVIELEFCE